MAVLEVSPSRGRDVVSCSISHFLAGMLGLALFLDYVGVAESSTTWEHLSLRYGIWHKPPRTTREAKKMGYIRKNEICKMDTYHGFLYVQPHNEKSRLIFDLDDKLAGIQTSIPGNMFGYNHLNESIVMPTTEIIPPILLSQEPYGNGDEMYTVTAYFKHPSSICSPVNQHRHPGKGLFIQMGYQVERQYEKIPLDARHLSKEWKTGTCLPAMGQHYFKQLTPALECERLYPVFLMYNHEAQLSGFGWLFQGNPLSESNRAPVKWFRLNPQLFPAVFDEKMLPSCMFNPDFRIFGIRIYLRNENNMICPDGPYSKPKEETHHHKHHHGTRHRPNHDDVTYRPLHPRYPPPTNSSVGGAGTRGAASTIGGGKKSDKTPEFTNTRNVIVDDAMRRNTNDHNSATSLQGSLLSCPSMIVLAVLVAVSASSAIKDSFFFVFSFNYLNFGLFASRISYSSSR